MKNLIISTFALFPLVFYVQKTEKLSNESTVMYNVNDKGLKDGAYTINDRSNNTILRGVYVDGKRSGDWYAFNKDGEVLLRYNYALKKLVTLNDKQISAFEYKIIAKEEETAKGARIPVAICGADLLKSYVASQLLLQMPLKLKANKARVSGKVLVMINDSGSAKYVVDYGIEGIAYKTTIDLDNKFFQVDWIPASFENTNYKSEVKFDIDFSIDPSEQRRFIWNY